MPDVAARAFLRAQVAVILGDGRLEHRRAEIRAVSRALQRARGLFQDDLVVRSPNGFELTLRGRKILDELEGLLPRMENLVAPALFDPTREKSHFRISGPDNVCTVVVPRMCRQYAKAR